MTLSISAFLLNGVNKDEENRTQTNLQDPNKQVAILAERCQVIFSIAGWEGHRHSGHLGRASLHLTVTSPIGVVGKRACRSSKASIEP